MNCRGVTVIELMIAAAILSIGALSLIATFGGIQKGIQFSKNKTLASNLAQEKMQILKQKNYYQVLVTTDPAYNTDFTPNIAYDSGYFPSESILEGGVRYDRLTYIQVAREDSGVIVTLPPTTPDTGMRLITVTVVWSQGNEKKKVEMRSLLSNPDTVMANAIFSGVVRNASTMSPIAGALVNMAENLGWRDTTSAAGTYSINLAPGNFTMMASAPGYFSEFRTVSIAANQSLTQDFNLVAMASGTVQGTVWINNHLLISQVVGSTQDGNGFFQEYVELYNPTTYTWTIASGPTTPVIDLKYQIRSQSMATIAMNYSAMTVGPNSFYLFANTGTITAGGVARNADAVFSNTNPGYPNLIKINTDAGNDAAGLGIAWTSNAVWIDRLGWKTGGNDPPVLEGAGMNQAIGLEDGEQYLRRSSTSGWAAGQGRAYDSGDNNTDFADYYTGSWVYAPRNSTDIEAPISGTPAIGAVVSATDGLSVSTTAYSMGNPPRADFSLGSVATGTWVVLMSSGQYALQNDTVTIAAGGSLRVFPSSTTFLSQSNSEGFISGTVTSALGAAISPAIAVSPGAAGLDTTADTSFGRYLLRVAPGSVDVVANPNSADPNYISQSSNSIAVGLGEIRSGVNFVLSQGGRISGFVTRDGINALPGISVAVIDSNGYSRDQQISDASGRFTTVTVATGVYSVEPALGSHETSSPTARTTIVTTGSTVFSGTFTITGALGTIRGNVSAGSRPIPTGVLVVVTTTTLSGAPPAPPALSSATLTGNPYYATSSREDGTYSVEVRQSTSPAYRVYAYYVTLNGSTPVINSSSTANVQVLAGQTVTGVNFAW